MTGRIAERLLWAIALAGVVAAISQARRATPLEVTTEDTIAAAPSVRDWVHPAAIARWAGAVRERSAFHVPPVRDEGRGDELPQHPGNGRPAVALAGILGGPPWEAVLEGLPGRSGSTLAREGEVFDEVVVAAVAPDSVVLTRGKDTWTLRVRSPWQ